MRLVTYDQFPEVPGPLIAADPIFFKLGALKIDDVFKYQVCKFIYKCLYQLTPINFHNWFKLNTSIHDYNTRTNFNTSNNSSTKKLFTPYARTTNYGLKQLTVNGPRIWNALPVHLTNEKSLLVFLRNVKIHLMSGYDRSSMA